MRSRLYYLLISVAVLATDQLSKYWAMTTLKPKGWIDVIDGFFRLTYATNRGVAFSLFADSQMNVRLIFGTISTVAAVFVITYLLRTPANAKRLLAAMAQLNAGKGVERNLAK